MSKKVSLIKLFHLALKFLYTLPVLLLVPLHFPVACFLVNLNLSNSIFVLKPLAQDINFVIDVHQGILVNVGCKRFLVHFLGPLFGILRQACIIQSQGSLITTL